MISLPSKYTAGFAAKAPVTYFIDIVVLNGAVTQHLYITNQPAAEFTYNSVPLSASGSVQSSYLGAVINSSGQEEAINGIGEIDFAIDNTGGGTMSSANTLSLLFLNQGDFVHSHSYDFENQSVVVYKSFGTGSFTVETDMVPIFRGVITQAYTYDPTRFQIDCVDRRQIDQGFGPRYLISNTTCPHADQNAFGKFIPTLFGDFTTVNNTLVMYDHTDRYHGLLPHVLGKLFAAPTMITDIYSCQSLISDSPFTISASAYVTDDSSQYIAVLSASQYTRQSGSVGILTPAGAMQSIMVTPTFGELWTIPKVQGYRTDAPSDGLSCFGSGTYIADFGNAVDGNLDTFVEVNEKFNVGTGLWEDSFLQVSAANFTEPGTFIDREADDYAYDLVGHTIDFYFGGVFEYTGGALDSEFVVVMQDALYTIQQKRLSLPAAAQDTPFAMEWPINVYQDFANWLPGKVSPDLAAGVTLTWDMLRTRLLFGIGSYQEAFGGGSGDDGTKRLRIRHLWIRARTRFENTGITKKGMYVPQYAEVTSVTPLGKTWGSSFQVSTSRQQTGVTWEKRGSGISNLFVSANGPKYTDVMRAYPRTNGHNIGDLVQSPAAVIEYLLRYKLGIPTADIDTVSFDRLDNITDGQRKDWKVAISMLEHKPALDYIQTVCQEFGLSLFVTQAGQYRVVAHDTVATPALAIQPSDIYFDGFPQIFISTTDNSAIYNDITLQYGFDYTRSKCLTGVYVSNVNADPTNVLLNNLISNTGALRGGGGYDAWLGDSITRYKCLRQTALSSTMIQDAVTANLAIKKLMDWLAFKRLLVEMYLVPNIGVSSLELGDIITINSDYLTTIYQDVAQFMVTGIRVPGVGTTQDPYITVDCIELPSAVTGTPILTNHLISSDDLVHGV